MPRPLSALLMAMLLCVAARAEAEACGPHYVAWTFRTASPISAPLAVDAEGQVYAATHEGYLHALRADGQFLWSYTVSGALLVGAHTDTAKRVYVASSEKVIYALEPSGKPHWVFHSPVRPDSGLSVNAKGVVHFASGAFIYAVSQRAGLLWRAPLGALPVGDLFEAKTGEAWIVTEDGTLHAVRTPYRHRRFSLPLGATFALVGVTETLALVIVDGRLHALNRKGELRWSTPGGVVAAALDEVSPALVVVREETVEFLDVNTGSIRKSVAHHAELSARPAAASGRAFLPALSGELQIVSEAGEVNTCRVADAALLSPVVFDGRVIVAAGTGLVAAIQLLGTAP